MKKIIHPCFLLIAVLLLPCIASAESPQHVKFHFTMVHEKPSLIDLTAISKTQYQQEMLNRRLKDY